MKKKVLFAVSFGVSVVVFNVAYGSQGNSAYQYSHPTYNTVPQAGGYPYPPAPSSMVPPAGYNTYQYPHTPYSTVPPAGYNTYQPPQPPSNMVPPAGYNTYQPPQPPSSMVPPAGYNTYQYPHTPYSTVPPAGCYPYPPAPSSMSVQAVSNAQQNPPYSHSSASGGNSSGSSSSASSNANKAVARPRVKGGVGIPQHVFKKTPSQSSSSSAPGGNSSDSSSSASSGAGKAVSRSQVKGTYAPPPRNKQTSQGNIPSAPGGNSSGSSSSASSSANDAKQVSQQPKRTPPSPAEKWSVIVDDRSGNVITAIIPGSRDEEYFFDCGQRLSKHESVEEIKLSGAELTNEKVDALFRGLDSGDGVTNIEMLAFEGETKISDEWFQEITSPEKRTSNDHDPVKRKGFCIKALKGDDIFMEHSRMCPEVKVKFSDEQLNCFLYSVGDDALQTVFAQRADEVRRNRREKGHVDVWINKRSLTDFFEFGKIGKALSIGYEYLCFNFHLTGFNDKDLFYLARDLWESSCRLSDFKKRFDPFGDFKFDLRGSSSITPAGIEIMRDILTRAKINVKELKYGRGAEGEAQPLMTVEYGGGKIINIFDGNIEDLKKAIFPPLNKNMSREYRDEVAKSYSKIKFHVLGRGKNVEFFDRIGGGIASVLERGFWVEDTWPVDCSIDLRNNEIDGELLDSFIFLIVYRCSRAKFLELDLSENQLSEQAIRGALAKFRDAGIKIKTLVIKGNPGYATMKPIVEIIDKNGKKEFYKENVGSLELSMEELPEYSTVFRIKNCDKDASLDVWRQLGIAISSYIEKISSMDLSNNGFEDKEITSFFDGVCRGIDERANINELILDRNNITAAGLMDIINMCREKKIRIKRLRFNDNPSIAAADGIILLYASRMPDVKVALRVGEPQSREVSYKGNGNNEKVWDLLKDMDDGILWNKVSRCDGKAPGGEAIRLLERGVNDGSFRYKPGEKKNLDLAGRIISDADVPQLIELLQLLSNKGVRHVFVDLRDNFISDAGVSLIVGSDVFRSPSKCLVEIDVYNNIVSEKVRSLLTGIERHTQNYAKADEELTSQIGEQDRTRQLIDDQYVQTVNNIEAHDAEIDRLKETLAGLEAKRDELINKRDDLSKQMADQPEDPPSIKETRGAMKSILEDRLNEANKLALFAGYSASIRENKKYIEEQNQKIKQLKRELDDKESETDKNAAEELSMEIKRLGEVIEALQEENAKLEAAIAELFKKPEPSKLSKDDKSATN